MSYWSKAQKSRTQACLFYPTLEEMITEDHPVRLVEEILNKLEWKEWEETYNGQIGQPPIHPRIVSGVLLYGITQGIRSSRRLEEACGNRIDFMWLTEGRILDHTTLAKFRMLHEKEMKKLGKEVCRIARQMSLITLEVTATDGTRIQANSSRHKTGGREELIKWIQILEEKITLVLNEISKEDKLEDERYGETGSGARLPVELSRLEERAALLKKAQEELGIIEESRKEHGKLDSSKRAKIPVSDPESRVLPNKEGGFSPNYTPVITVDGENGFIVDGDVTNSTDESQIQRLGMDRIEETYGEIPKIAMGDGLYSTLENVAEMEKKGVKFLGPVPKLSAREGEAAYREDPRVLILRLFGMKFSN